MQVGKTVTYIKTNEEEEEEEEKKRRSQEATAAVPGHPRPWTIITSEGGLGRDGTSVFWTFCRPDSLLWHSEAKTTAEHANQPVAREGKDWSPCRRENRRPQDGVLLQSGPIGSTEAGRDVERVAQKGNK